MWFNPALILITNKQNESVVEGILTQLVSDLKKIGYDTFLDEGKSSKSLTQAIESMNEAEQAYQELARQFAELNLNLQREEDINAYTKRKQLSIFKKETLKKIVEDYPSIKVCQTFLTALAANNINYQMVNPNNMASMVGFSGMYSLYQRGGSSLCKFYLSSETAPFGRMGLESANIMYFDALKQMTAEEVKASFLIINNCPELMLQNKTGKEAWLAFIENINLQSKDAVQIIINKIIDRRKALRVLTEKQRTREELKRVGYPFFKSVFETAYNQDYNRSLFSNPMSHMRSRLKEGIESQDIIDYATDPEHQKTRSARLIHNDEKLKLMATMLSSPRLKK